MTNHYIRVLFFQFDLILKIEFEGKYEYRIFQAQRPNDSSHMGV